MSKETTEAKKAASKTYDQLFGPSKQRSVIKDSKYNINLQPEFIEQGKYKKTLAINQGGWDEAMNGLTRGIVSGLATAVEDFAYIPNIFTQDFEANALAQAMKDVKEDLREALPIYREGDSPFSMDSEFVWESIAGVLDSGIGFAIPGMAIAKGIGKVGKLAALGRFGTRTAALRQSALANPVIKRLSTSTMAGVISNDLEGTMMGVEIFENKVKELQEKRNLGLISLSDDEIRSIAHQQASAFKTYNRAFALTDAFALRGLTRGHGTTRNLIQNPQGFKKTLQSYKNQGMKGKVKQLGKRLTDPNSLLAQGLTEGFEEISQGVMQQSAEYNIDKLAGLDVKTQTFVNEQGNIIATKEKDFFDRIMDYAFNEDTLYEGMLGFFGGGLQRVSSELMDKGSEHFTKKSIDRKIANISSAIEKLDLENPQEAATKSVLEQMVSALQQQKASLNKMSSYEKQQKVIENIKNDLDISIGKDIELSELESKFSDDTESHKQMQQLFRDIRFRTVALKHFQNGTTEKLEESIKNLENDEDRAHYINKLKQYEKAYINHSGSVSADLMFHAYTEIDIVQGKIDAVDKAIEEIKADPIGGFEEQIEELKNIKKSFEQRLESAKEDYKGVRSNERAVEERVRKYKEDEYNDLFSKQEIDNKEQEHKNENFDTSAAANEARERVENEKANLTKINNERKAEGLEPIGEDDWLLQQQKERQQKLQQEPVLEQQSIEEKVLIANLDLSRFPKGAKVISVDKDNGDTVDITLEVQSAQKGQGAIQIKETVNKKKKPSDIERSGKILSAKFIEQGTQFEIEIQGDKRPFLLVWNRNNPTPSLFGEKQSDGTYKSTDEFPSKEQIQKLVDKYVPKNLVNLINEWTAASKLPPEQVLDTQEKIEKRILSELSALEKTTKIQPAKPIKKTSKEVLETDIEITEEAQLNSDVGEVRNEQSEVGAKLVEPANFEKLQPFKELLEDGSNKVGLKVEFVISEDDSDYTKESVKSQVAFNKNEGDPDSNKRIDYLTNNAAIRVYFLNSKGERLKDKNGQEIFTFLYKPEGASSEAVGNRERKIRQVIVKTLLANKQAFGKVQGQYPYMFNNTSPVQENRLDDISAFGATSEEIRNNIVFASNGLTKEGEMSSFGAGWMNYKGVRSIDVPSKKFETSEDVRRFAGRVGIKIKNINGKTSVAKLNVKKLTEEDANFVFDLYKYGASKNQKSLDIKLDRDQEGIDLIEKFKSIVGDSIKPPATVREMIAFFVHEAGYKRDGRKQWNRQTQIRLFQGGLKFGETFKDGNQLNEKETRRQVVDFLMTKKRYNILKNKMSDIKYVEWLIENKILNTDLDIENPLTSSKTFSGAMFIKSDDIEVTESVKSREIKPNSRQDKTLRFLNNLLKLQMSDNKYVIRNKEGEIVKSFTRVSDFIKGAPSDINNFTAVEIGNAVDAVARDYFAGKDMTNWQKYKDPSNNKQYFESKEVFDSLIDQMRPLMQMIKDNGGVAFTEEITLFDSEKGVAGTPDMMVVWPSGKISIVDFKAFKKGKARLEEKQDGESVLDFYTKQQNVYRILAKNMGFNVAAANLMVFHVNYEEEKYVVTGTGNDFGLTEQLKRTNDVNGLVLKNQEEDKTPSRQDDVLTKKPIEQEGPSEKSPEEVDKKPTEPTQPAEPTEPSGLGEAPSEDQMSEMPKGLFSKKETKQKEEDVVEEEKVYFYNLYANKTIPEEDGGKPMKKERAIFEMTYNPVTGEGRVDIINPNNQLFADSYEFPFKNSVKIIGESPRTGRPFKGGVQIKPGVAKKIDGKWVITTPVEFEFLYDDDGPRTDELFVTLAYRDAKKNYPETQESLEDLLMIIDTLDEKTTSDKSKKKGLMQYADELKEKLKNKPDTPSTDQTRKEEEIQEDSESQDMINDILKVAETGELLDDDTPNNGQSTDSEEADNTCD